MKFLKFITFLCLVPALMIHHTFINFLIRSPEVKLRKFVTSLQSYSRMGLKILGIELIYDFNPSEIRNHLVVSNHLSYLDVLCFSALIPASYVTSMEIKHTPILGQLCQLCGCVFTERRRKFRTLSRQKQEIAQMETVLSSGINLILFPEGTSTNGSSVLPFKTSLLEASGSFVPMALHYNSAVVPWFGDMTFLPHLWKLCGHQGIKCRVMLGETYLADSLEGRKEVGPKLYQRVSELHSKCNFLSP